MMKEYRDRQDRPLREECRDVTIHAEQIIARVGSEVPSKGQSL